MLHIDPEIKMKKALHSYNYVEGSLRRVFFKKQFNAIYTKFLVA